MSYRSSRKQRGFTLIELLVVIAIIAILAAILFPVFARARENARRAVCQSNEKQIGLAFAQYSQDYDERLPSATSTYGGGGVRGGWMYYTNWDGKDGNTNFDPSQGTLWPYMKNSQIFSCPSDALGTHLNSYAINSCTQSNALEEEGKTEGLNLAAFEETARFGLIYEEAFCLTGYSVHDANSATSDDGYYPAKYEIDGENKGGPSGRHFDGSNVLFLDGHVKWLRIDRIRATDVARGGTATCPGTTDTPYDGSA